MSERTSTNGKRSDGRHDRRTPAGTHQDPAPTLRKLKGALGRPLAIERRDGQLRLVLVERRRAAQDHPLQARMAMALRAHLARSAGSARHCAQLGMVSAQLADQGWPGVAKLPASVLSRAVAQAEVLAREEFSELLSAFIDRLRLVRADAEAREERRPARRLAPDASSMFVAEATQEEFEALQRSWEGTVPGVLAAVPDDPASDPR